MVIFQLPVYTVSNPFTNSRSGPGAQLLPFPLTRILWLTVAPSLEFGFMD